MIIIISRSNWEIKVKLPGEIALSKTNIELNAIAQMKQTGEPIVLTVNGKPEVMVSAGLICLGYHRNISFKI